MSRLIEQAIGSVADGARPSDVLERCVSRALIHTCEDRRYIRATGKAYVDGEAMRTFFDGTGELRFASLDDVLIDPTSDDRLSELVEYADNISVDSELFDLFDTFVGSLGDLYSEVTDNYYMATTSG
jgi:hypothetical protein